MKKTIILSLALCGACVAGFTSCTPSSTPSASLKTAVDSASYSVGVNFGDGLKSNLETAPGEKLNVDDLIAGFITAIKGDSANLKISPADAQQIVATYFQAASEKEGKETLEAGQKFLAEKEKEAGVIKTESGLLYKVEKEGNGPKPTVDSKIKVNYKGSLIDGTVFESTEDRGGPVEFVLGGMIPGWVEGIRLMPVGSKYTFYIPSELAYGPQARSAQLKANSTLVFEVELLDIVKDEPAAKK